jgi:hypothetical protein
MNLPKIRRELTRPLKQLLRLPARVTSLLFQPWVYDTLYSRWVKAYFNDRITSEYLNVCIFVVFPKVELKPSHYHTIEHLSKAGFHPVVVSNGDLAQEEIEKLSKLTITLIIRPNIGYDFGGYREGVLFLLKIGWLKYGKNLILLNDSCWFPVHQKSCWIEKALRLPYDFIGVTSNFGIPRSRGAVNLEDKWRYSTENRNFHYASFCLLIRDQVFQKNYFQSFWKNYSLTNDKKTTVRRGEIGLSQLVIRNKQSHHQTQNIENLPRLLGIRTDEEIFEIVRNTVIMDQPTLFVSKKSLVRKIENWGGNKDFKVQEDLRGECIHFLLLCCTRQGGIYTLMFHDVKYGNLHFIKKSPLEYGEDNRLSVLATIGQLTQHHQFLLTKELGN